MYRLSKGGKDLRFRYMNNTAAMWLVFMAFSFMIAFVKRNGAAHFKIRPAFYMVPIHLVYLMMLLLGMNKDFGAYCTYHTYPYIFVF